MQTILKGWNVMRVLRLGIGIMAIIQGYQQGSWPLAIAGFFVMILALANLGCCGTGACAVNNRRSNNNSKKEITYEELGN